MRRYRPDRAPRSSSKPLPADGTLAAGRFSGSHNPSTAGRAGGQQAASAAEGRAPFTSSRARLLQSRKNPILLRRTLQSRQGNRMSITKSLSMLGVTAALVPLALGLAGCEPGQPRAASGPPPPPQVTVAKPTKRLLTDHDEYVGRFVAVDAVEVRARVSGYLDTIHFKDGQLVKKGDLLFTIDRRPFEASLAQAEATLSQARANLAYAEADLQRGQGLVRGNTITQQTFDQRTQAKRVAEASVKAQEAALRQATLDLEFTELRAPVAGRIGDRRVSAGNLVTGGTSGSTTLLATITSIDPIRFEFTMDEASYLRSMRLAGEAGSDRGTGVAVKLKLIDEAN